MAFIVCEKRITIPISRFLVNHIIGFSLPPDIVPSVVPLCAVLVLLLYVTPPFIRANCA